MLSIPSKFVPQTPADFVGSGDYGAATVARTLTALVAQMKAAGSDSRAFLLNGAPGIGKSALARWLIHDLLGCQKWSVTRLNGTQVNLERVEELAAALPYRDLYTDYKAIWFEECDKMSLPAQVRLLTLLDDLETTKGVVMVCTSNCKLNEFEPRFCSRFVQFELQPPSSDEVATLLRRWLRSEQAIRWLAVNSAGNVRLALKDADLQYAVECGPGAGAAATASAAPAAA